MNKQIEEMANDLAKICPDLVENCCGQVNCVSHLTLSLSKIGYRKSTDVARDIMREVRQALLNMVLANSMGETYDIEKCFAEIEKKYESEGEE